MLGAFYMSVCLKKSDWLLPNAVYSRWSIWMVIPDIRHCKFRAPRLSFTEKGIIMRASQKHTQEYLLHPSPTSWWCSFFPSPILFVAPGFLLSSLVVDEVWMFLMPVESLIWFVNSWMERHSLPKVPTGEGGRFLSWQKFSNTEMA